jgi:hypothetical protein
VDSCLPRKKRNIVIRLEFTRHASDLAHYRSARLERVAGRIGRWKLLQITITVAANPEVARRMEANLLKDRGSGEGGDGWRGRPKIYDLILLQTMIPQ